MTSVKIGNGPYRATKLVSLHFLYICFQKTAVLIRIGNKTMPLLWKDYKNNVVLRSEIRSGICAKLRTVTASNNRDHLMRSLYYCLFAPHTYIFVLRAHPVHGESRNQRNTTGEVATTSPPFYNESHRSHVLCVKAELRMTFTSWSQHHFVAIRNPERHVRKASHCDSKQQ